MFPICFDTDGWQNRGRGGEEYTAHRRLVLLIPSGCLAEEESKEKLRSAGFTGSSGNKAADWKQ